MNKTNDPSRLDRSVWLKTAAPSDEFPMLDGEFEADIGIIGGGYTGLSAALHLAKSGKKVALVEAHGPGNGASGRNAGGYLPVYMDRTPADVRRIFGDAAGAGLNQMVAESSQLMLEMVRDYGIEADLRTDAFLMGAHMPGQKGREKLLAIRNMWIAEGLRIDVMERDAMSDCIGMSSFEVGLRFKDGGTINPISLARGLARAARSEGADIFCKTPAIDLTFKGDSWRITTRDGMLNARNVLIATDGYASEVALWPALEMTMYHVPVAGVASKPSPDLSRKLSPRGFALADDNATSHLYMTFDSQDRLIGSLLPPWRYSAAAADVARPYELKLRRIFGDIPAIEWESFWLGTVGISAERVPRCLRLDSNLHAISGYSGQGITAAIASGKEYASFICADNRESACRLPFMDPRPVPLRRTLPRVIRHVGAPLIRLTDRTYRSGKR
ncbi:NAD(P)/FAD-dependent oxidoreductase [Paraburkholderia megapolitana]|uniref:NAD(P)/FAD-dependent oxidoreductase n=1 Tax=Paraburkholderia megapolitana TaxID=420953 RepID=UPI0038B7DED9